MNREIIVEITKYDIELFKGLLYRDNEPIEWSFKLDDEYIDIKFVKGE